MYIKNDINKLFKYIVSLMVIPMSINIILHLPYIIATGNLW